MLIHYDDASENRHPPSKNYHETRARTIVSLSKQSASIVIAPKNINAFCAPNKTRWKLYKRAIAQVQCYTCNAVNAKFVDCMTNSGILIY